MLILGTSCVKEMSGVQPYEGDDEVTLSLNVFTGGMKDVIVKSKWGIMMNLSVLFIIFAFTFFLNQEDWQVMAFLENLLRLKLKMDTMLK